MNNFLKKNQQTTKAKKIGVVGFHMLGLATLWYYQLKQTKGPLSSEEFQRFGPHENRNLMGELVMLRVKVYQCQLQARDGIG